MGSVDGGRSRLCFRSGLSIPSRLSVRSWFTRVTNAPRERSRARPDSVAPSILRVAWRLALEGWQACHRRRRRGSSARPSRPSGGFGFHPFPPLCPLLSPLTSPLLSPAKRRSWYLCHTSSLLFLSAYRSADATPRTPQTPQHLYALPHRPTSGKCPATGPSEISISSVLIQHGTLEISSWHQTTRELRIRGRE